MPYLKLGRLALVMSTVLLLGNALMAAENFSEKRLNAFLTAFNSGDSLQWKSFLMEDPKSRDSAAVFERRFNFFREVHANSGGFEQVNIVRQSEFSIAALLKAVSPRGPMDWIEFTLNYDSLPPHQLASLMLQPADDPSVKLPTGELTAEKIAAFLNPIIDELVAADRFSGTVLVAKNGKILFTRAAGEACKSYGVPNRLDTKFNLGSMNKMFTGVAIGQLAQQGKLSFDDPIIKHLPDYSDKEVASKVTIHQLLTHTSGMGDYWDELFSAKYWEIRTVPQLADLIINEPLEFEPGQQFRYSNSGPVILGLIIERITGMSYYDYIRQYVTSQAGMTNTDYYAVDDIIPNLAIGYTKMDFQQNMTDSYRANYFMHAVKGGPAGGGYSTVEDLLKFDIALRNHRLLSREMTDSVTAGKVPMGPEMQYAYLFGDERTPKERIVGHNGGAPGINAVLNMYMSSGYTVAVMANYDNAAETMARKIDRMILNSL